MARLARPPAGANEGGFIKYNAWSYSRQLIPGAPSGTQVIGTGIRGQILEGQPAFLPPNEKVKCFDMTSIRNKCNVNTQVGGGLPVSCTIQLSACSAITGEVHTKPAVYDPKSPTTPFALIVFPETFKCIDRVDITLISAAVPGGGVTVAAVFDDFKYVAYVKA